MDLGAKLTYSGNFSGPRVSRGPPGGRHCGDFQYKKCQADDVTKQYRALITLPTTMRLSVLALFIALPTMAYGAVYPRQTDGFCINKGLCDVDQDCCGTQSGPGQCISIGDFNVRLIVCICSDPRLGLT